MTMRSFRSAAGSGRLAKALCAGKYLTTPKAVRAFLKPNLKPCRAAKKNRRDSGNAPTAPGSSSIADDISGRAARAAGRATLRARR
ncbi:MAG TPA: hypothetical protein VIH40_11780, partial [Xanthobacteraceae bacterium]